VETSDHLSALEAAGHRFAAVADDADLDSAVPTCPGWTVRDLVWHLGEVHRWAGTHVAERRQERVRFPGGVSGPKPTDDDLVDWYRDGHAWLLDTLRSADPDVECWSFLPAPSPLAFWARRQAHEASIHRADAEGAVGPVTPFEPAFAADGVDELLIAFFGSRPPGARAPDPAEATPLGTVHLRADDARRDWLMRMSDRGVETTPEAGDADCDVVAAASDLYLLFWNRRSDEGLDVSGDRSLLDHWRQTAQIRWGGA
jgi:uncharacterized protein (TIGR03083 family)